MAREYGKVVGYMINIISLVNSKQETVQKHCLTKEAVQKNFQPEQNQKKKLFLMIQHNGAKLFLHKITYESLDSFPIHQELCRDIVNTPKRDWRIPNHFEHRHHHHRSET